MFLPLVFGRDKVVRDGLDEPPLPPFMQTGQAGFGRSLVIRSSSSWDVSEEQRNINLV